MSALELIADVIEEIHFAERSLQPGDIPDRRLFKHVKSLWHLLLGITESDFDSHNYEFFELDFHKEDTKFFAFTYLGNNVSQIKELLVGAVGSSEESLNNVRLLDDSDESNDPDMEQSVSFKLSLLNKIRFILFEHHIFLANLFNESVLESFIEKYIRDDILNSSNKLSVSLKSNSYIFNECYKNGVYDLLNLDDNISINAMAKQIIQNFKLKSRLAFFFDYDLLVKFHDNLQSPLKKIFKKHTLATAEIHDYYEHDPILPILKPIYRKIQSLDVTELETEEAANKITIDLLLEVVQQVTYKGLENYQDIPVTMQWFPKIIRYYCDSLTKEGILDLENDLYVGLIKTVIVKWIDGLIDTPKFISQLSDLSLIPTALPYLFEGTILPTVHMRMALYSVKEIIRLEEKYFDLWINKKNNKSFLVNQWQKWGTNKTRIYFNTWKQKLLTVKKMDSKSVCEIMKVKEKNALNIWKRKIEIIKNDENMADFKLMKIFFNKWSNRKNSIVQESNKAQTLLDHKLLIKFMTIWMNEKVNCFDPILDDFYKMKKVRYFNKWSNVYDNIIALNFTADKFHNNNVVTSSFKIWKGRTSDTLSRLKHLNDISNNFIISKQFKIWGTQIILKKLEADYIYDSSKKLLKKFFDKWYIIKKLNDYSSNIINDNNINLMHIYFTKWNTIFEMKTKADIFHRTKKIEKSFRVWKLETLGRSFLEAQNRKTERQYLLKLKLEATAKQYKECKELLCLNKYFLNWNDKVFETVNQLSECSEAYSILSTATYFDFWKKQTDKIKKDEGKADKFKQIKSNNDEIKYKMWMFNTFKLCYRESRLKRLELNRIERINTNKFVSKFFKIITNRKKNHDLINTQAKNYYSVTLKSKYFDYWLNEFDNITELNNIYINKHDTDNVDLLMRYMSKMQLHMIKTKTDEMNADKFKERWNRLKTKTFYELWKFKLSSNTSPTPAARYNKNKNDNNNNTNDDDMNIPDLNPYIDLGPKGRGSPQFRNTSSRMKSVLTGEITDFQIKEQISESDITETPISNRFRLTPSRFRTPIMRRSSSRLLQTQSSMVIDINNLTSAERVRKRNLEERVSRYRLLKSPPKSNRLDKVEEENSGPVYRNESTDNIFDTTFESIQISSTPLRNE